MKVTPNEWVNGMSGSIGGNTYARRTADPNILIVQRKPNRSLKRGQKRPAGTQAGIDTMRRASARVKEVYHNPEQRAVWEAEYHRLETACQKKGSRAINGGKLCSASGGYDLPYRFYDWLRMMIMREEYRQQ